MKHRLLFVTLLLLAAACKKEEEQPAPPPPVTTKAAFTLPGTTDTNTPVQVQNQSFDATAYRWTWGDGTVSTDASPSHSWAQLGYYRVRLQATGPSGVDTLSKVVHVNQLGPPPLSPIAGNYTGHWSFDTYGVGPGTHHSEGNNTEQLSVVSYNSLLFRGLTLTFTPAATPWAGHAPQRSHYDFTLTGSFYSNQKTLQVEQAGDSIYFINQFTSSGGSTYYRGCCRTLVRWLKC